LSLTICAVIYKRCKSVISKESRIHIVPESKLTNCNSNLLMKTSLKLNILDLNHISLSCFNKYLLTLINVHKCKRVNATSTHRRLLGFSGFTDMLMCRRVSFSSSSIMSLSGRYNSGNHHRLNGDTSALTVANAPKMVLFFIHFYGLVIVEY
jgi:hypothetical protein